jgi:hypothetical protein
MKRIAIITLILCLGFLNTQAQTTTPPAQPVQAVGLPFEEQFNLIEFKDLAPNVQAFIEAEVKSRGEKIQTVYRFKKDPNILAVRTTASDGALFMHTFEENTIPADFGEEKKVEEEEVVEETEEEENKE